MMSLKITNLAVRQPLSPFFVMTHNEDADPLFTFGAPASDALAIQAEDGNPADLVAMFENTDGVGEVFAFADGAPFFGGNSLTIDVPVDRDYPLISLSSMAINTNDCFIAINGAELSAGDVLYLPGLDAGSEENNENCNSIPGPACENRDPTNQRDGNGEGFVHVHPGFFGMGESGLTAVRYDWRNPMVRVEVL